jgi:hypothetical protein
MSPPDRAPRQSPKSVERGQHHYYVEIRPESEFDELRTPLAAETTPRSLVGEGCDVREGRVGPDTWLVQSVLVPLDAADSAAAATVLAQRVVTERES